MAKLQNNTSTFSNSADRFLLVLAGIGGVVVISILKLRVVQQMNDSEWLIFSPAAAAIAVLLVYAIAVRTVSAQQVEPETAGDNCYYLGFFFTLVSLAITLYQTTGYTETENRDQLLAEIISGFGIALSSTIVGIALRVWFFQQRTDLVARDRETQKEVQKAVREFRTSLLQSTASFKRFTTQSVQSAAEREEVLNKTTVELIDQLKSTAQHLNQLNQLLQDHQREFQNYTKDLSGHIESAMQEGFNAAANRTAEAISTTLTRSFSEVETAAVKLSERMNQLPQIDQRTLSDFTRETEKTHAMIIKLNRSAKKLKSAYRKSYEQIDVPQEIRSTTRKSDPQLPSSASIRTRPLFLTRVFLGIFTEWPIRS